MCGSPSSQMKLMAWLHVSSQSGMPNESTRTPQSWQSVPCAQKGMSVKYAASFTVSETV